MNKRYKHTLRPDATPIYTQKNKNISTYINICNDIIDENNEITSTKIYEIIYMSFEDTYELLINFFKQEFDFSDQDCDQILPIKKLIYHKNGWDLYTSIKEEINFYLTSSLPLIKKQERLKKWCKTIIETENERILQRYFLEATKEKHLFIYVIITGEDLCGNCGGNYGKFLVEECINDDDKLPPYHPGCGCYTYYDNN